ncbi:uncharacterized protein BDZ99DRAFT_92423 [Mytilinidion resinicola]|uniref:Uncharacterized protein n=1 Tax=Mytilinidion resinicola TaxID=574789 RepID=A0A6A6YCC2_9PEZI|nr:uncharacterized protein BDZ99DRAFT_92423 [Mytilinidion resinicola]KAF2806228.1 hypothetical protein BDZ99DRAFT_92423 [Mytilinidion resinicola]
MLIQYITYLVQCIVSPPSSLFNGKGLDTTLHKGACLSRRWLSQSGMRCSENRIDCRPLQLGSCERQAIGETSDGLVANYLAVTWSSRHISRSNPRIWRRLFVGIATESYPYYSTRRSIINSQMTALGQALSAEEAFQTITSLRTPTVLRLMMGELGKRG